MLGHFAPLPPVRANRRRPLPRRGLTQMQRVSEPALVGIGAVLNQLDIDKANKY